MKIDTIRQTRKQLKSDLKSIIKHINIEIRRLNNEIKECIKTVDGFERFISESIFFIKDRDNLISSHLLHIHKNRILYIKSIMDRIASNVFVDSSLIGAFRNNFLKNNAEIYTFVSGVDKSINENTTIILQQIPDYIQNINKKIISIIQYKKALEELLEVATTEYKRKNKKINLPT
jgi:hypothetical protein